MADERRAVLSERAVGRLVQAARPGTPVAVAPSAFGGLGVFCLRGFKPGETVCYFRGRATTTDSLYSEQLSPAELRKLSQYMMCNEAKRPGAKITCNVPLRRDHTGPRATILPDVLSGSLINEACSRPEGQFSANVEVDGNVTKPSKRPCPWLGDFFLDWPVIATRRLVPGEELLLCYGPSYSAREGYTPAASCGGCAGKQ